MSDENQTAEELAEQLAEDIDEEVLEVNVDELEERFEKYINYNVPPENARQTIVRNLASTADVEVGEALGNSGSGGNQMMKVEDITVEDEGEFINVEVQVRDIWDNDTDSIGQVGLVNDDTGRIKFKSWAKSDVPLLTEGQSYILSGVAVDEWQDRPEISLNSATEIEISDNEFEAPDNTVERVGNVVKVHDGSGLIRRCSEDDCNRVLESGECSVHGEVDGEFDLRIKAVIDDGSDTLNINLGRELTESVTGMTMEDSKALATQELDRKLVGVKMAEEIIGQYYRVSGWQNENGVLIAQEVELLDELDEYDVSDLIMRTDALTVDSSTEQTETEDEEAEQLN